MKEVIVTFKGRVQRNVTFSRLLLLEGGVEIQRNTCFLLPFGTSSSERLLKVTFLLHLSLRRMKFFPVPLRSFGTK